MIEYRNGVWLNLAPARRSEIAITRVIKTARSPTPTPTRTGLAALLAKPWIMALRTLRRKFHGHRKQRHSDQTC